MTIRTQRVCFIFVALLSLSVSSAWAAPLCMIPPKGVEEVDATPCFSSPGLRFLEAQPSALELSDIRRGPEAPVTFSKDDQVYCSYTPHPKSQTSPKFRCHLTDSSGTFFNKKGLRIPEAVQAGSEGTAFEDQLLDSKGEPILSSKGKPEEADELKVKYFKGGTQTGPHFEGSTLVKDSRTRENFVEVAIGRLFWALGVPVDYMYGADQLHCRGCSGDPFNQKAWQDTTATFRFVGIERKWEGKTIQKSWSFKKLTEKMPQWSERQRVEFQVYALALGLINYHNELEKQNRAACAKGGYDSKTLVCNEPVLFVQDVGGGFGGKAGGLGGENPRGSFKDWSKSKVFKKGCQLSNDLGSLKVVSRQAIEEMTRRMAPLGRDKIRAIFELARFEKMDPEFTQSMGSEAAVIDAWTDRMLQRFDEIRSAQCE